MNVTISLSTIKISADSLATETAKMMHFVDGISFTKTRTANHVNPQEYVDFYNVMKSSSHLIPDELTMVRHTFTELPDISISEFNTSSWAWAEALSELPEVFLYIILPVSMVVWCNAYNRRQRLMTKLSIIEQKMNSAAFLLKTAING